jgi:hypothetical protein
MNPRMDTNEHECKPLLLMLLPSFVFIRVHSWTSSFCWRSWRLGVLARCRMQPDVTARYRMLPRTRNVRSEPTCQNGSQENVIGHWSLVIGQGVNRTSCGL